MSTSTDIYVPDWLEDEDDAEATARFAVTPAREEANLRLSELVARAAKLLSEAEELALEFDLEFNISTEYARSLDFSVHGPYGEPGYRVDWDASTC